MNDKNIFKKIWSSFLYHWNDKPDIPENKLVLNKKGIMIFLLIIFMFILIFNYILPNPTLNKISSDPLFYITILFFYFFPFLWSYASDNQFKKRLFWGNLLLGWTGIGWLVALSIALNIFVTKDLKEYITEGNIVKKVKNIESNTSKQELKNQLLEDDIGSIKNKVVTIENKTSNHETLIKKMSKEKEKAKIKLSSKWQSAQEKAIQEEIKDIMNRKTSREYKMQIIKDKLRRGVLQDKKGFDKLQKVYEKIIDLEIKSKEITKAMYEEVYEKGDRKSRSTTDRQFKKLVKLGLLKKEGRGYILLPELPDPPKQ